MTLRKKLKIRNILREIATDLGFLLLLVFIYGVAGYFEVIH
jgi:hypothetical protein